MELAYRLTQLFNAFTISLYGNGVKAIEKTIIECLDRGILVDLINEKKHELEAHMRQSDKLKYAQYMKLSVEEGRAEGKAEGRAEGIAENREKTMRVIREADLSEEAKKMLIARLSF